MFSSIDWSYAAVSSNHDGSNQSSRLEKFSWAINGYWAIANDRYQQPTLALGLVFHENFSKYNLQFVSLLCLCYMDNNVCRKDEFFRFGSYHFLQFESTKYKYSMLAISMGTSVYFLTESS